MDKPTVIIYFTSPEAMASDLEGLPPVYIRSIEDALRANVNNCTVLRETILELENALALAKNLAAKCPDVK